MIELLGWHGAATAAGDSEPAARMRAAGDSRIKCVAVHAGTPSQERGAPPHTHDGVITALIGRPRWNDAGLAAHAREHGHHATLAHAYRAHGDQLFPRLGGHFAAALIDTRNDVVLLAIDRIGAYPLCYSVAGDTLVFGSTNDRVRAHPAVTASVDPQALYDFLYFHMIPSPETLFREIRKLEPAQVLRFENGKASLRFYWQPPFVDHDRANLAELEDTFMKTLRASVQRCDPDDTTGAFLSGGTDSSTVSGMLAGLRGDKPTKTYSIGFSQQGYDEIGYARIASKHFKTDQHEYYVTADDVAESFTQVAAAYDEPFGNSSAIPTLFCARLAYNDGTRVMLAGDGGDELYGGNARYAKQKIFDLYNRIPGVLRSAVLEPLFVGLPFANGLPPTRKIRSYIEQARQPMPDRMESYNFLHRDDPRRIFDAGFLGRIRTEHTLELLRDTWQRANSDDLLNRMLFLDWKITLADNDLRKVNRMCALAGVEVRYPMLDDELLELSARVPPGMKLKGQKLRWFFKHALRNFLPQEIINKPKHGFGLPFGEWLKESPRLQELVHSSLSDLKARRIVRPEFLDELISTHRDGHAAYYGTMIWVLAMLEQWLRQHKVNP